MVMACRFHAAHIDTVTISHSYLSAGNATRTGFMLGHELAPAIEKPEMIVAGVVEPSCLEASRPENSSHMPCAKTASASTAAYCAVAYRAWPTNATVRTCTLLLASMLSNIQNNRHRKHKNCFSFSLPVRHRPITNATVLLTLLDYKIRDAAQPCRSKFSRSQTLHPASGLRDDLPYSQSKTDFSLYTDHSYTVE